MARELIFGVNIETGKALNEITKLQKGIRQAKEEQTKLRKEFKAGRITQG